MNITANHFNIRKVGENEFAIYGNIWVGDEDLVISVPGTLTIYGNVNTENGNIILAPVDDCVMTVKVNGKIRCDGTLMGSGVIYCIDYYGSIVVIDGIKLDGFLGCMKHLICYGPCEVSSMSAGHIDIRPESRRSNSIK